MILDIIYGDEGKGNRISTTNKTAFGIKLAIPVAKVVKYITVAKKLIKDDKDANKKILSTRLKIANLEK